MGCRVNVLRSFIINFQLNQPVSFLPLITLHLFSNPGTETARGEQRWKQSGKGQKTDGTGVDSSSRTEYWFWYERIGWIQ